MVILVLLFILMFAFSVAALSLTTKQQNSVLKSGWDNLSTKTKAEFQKLGNCCGFDERNSSSTADPTCSEVFLRQTCILFSVASLSSIPYPCNLRLMVMKFNIVKEEAGSYLLFICTKCACKTFEKFLFLLSWYSG